MQALLLHGYPEWPMQIDADFLFLGESSLPSL
jgi:hypothetical protein